MPKKPPNPKNSEHCKKYYQKNKAKIRANHDERRKKLKDYVKNIKLNSACPCGENHISCLDFHHIDPTQKKFIISEGAHAATTFEKLKKEIDKCVILCKNCHAKLHWNKSH